MSNRFVSSNPMAVTRPGFRSWPVREVRMVQLDPIIFRLSCYLKDRMGDGYNQDEAIQAVVDFCNILGLSQSDRLLILAQQLPLIEGNQ